LQTDQKAESQQQQPMRAQLRATLVTVRMEQQRAGKNDCLSDSNDPFSVKDSASSKLHPHRLLLLNDYGSQQVAASSMATNRTRPRLLPPPVPDRNFRSLLTTDGSDSLLETEIEELKKRCDSLLLSRRLATLAAAAATAEVGEDVTSHRQPDEDDANLSEMIDLDEGSSVASLSLANKGKLCSGALIKGDGAKSSHRMANAPQQQATLQRPPPPPTHSRVLLRGSNRTLDLAGIGFGLANGSAMAASGTPSSGGCGIRGKIQSSRARNEQWGFETPACLATQQLQAQQGTVQLQKRPPAIRQLATLR
uniref:CG4626 n=1 Tax=Macrostomum lignano TaxID=282301 RepID=A0A1I8HJL8_9PLAT